MNVYMTEDEQVEAIKRWWKNYGNMLVTSVLVVVIAYFGWQWWQKQQTTVRGKASTAYEQMLVYINEEDKTGVEAVANSLIKDYPKTPYASLAAMILAKQAFYDENFDSAKQQLNWVIANEREEALQQIARLRLARILTVQQQVDEALKVLEIVNDETFMPLVSELRGDIYLGRGDFDNARKNYQLAIQAMPEAVGASGLLKMKIDNLPQTKQVLQPMTMG